MIYSNLLYTELLKIHPNWTIWCQSRGSYQDWCVLPCQSKIKVSAPSVFSPSDFVYHFLSESKLMDAYDVDEEVKQSLLHKALYIQAQPLTTFTTRAPGKILHQISQVAITAIQGVDLTLLQLPTNEDEEHIADLNSRIDQRAKRKSYLGIQPCTCCGKFQALRCFSWKPYPLLSTQRIS